MTSVLDLVKHYQSAIEKYSNDEQKVLKCINKLFNLGVTVQHLQETRVGRTVNALRKEPGEVGQAARSLVYKWKLMVAAEESDQETEEQNIDTSTHNGHSSGKDSDDNTQSRVKPNQDSSNTATRTNEHKEINGHYSGNKRKYHSSEEEEIEMKRSKHSSSSDDDYKRKSNVKVKKEETESDSHDESEDSQSDESDSEMSESSQEEVQVKQEIKKEHYSSHKPLSSKHSQINYTDKKRDLSSSKKSHESEKPSKHHSSHSKDKRSEKSSSKEPSSSKEKSSSHSSHKHKSSKEIESSSEKKHKSDHKSKETEKTHKESRSSSKHSSSEKHRSSSSHKSHTNSDKNKSTSEKHSSADKSKSSSSSHSSDKDKRKSSSEKQSSKDKTKDSSSHSSSSKEKHSSSSMEKLKDKISSSKERSSSHSEKKHSSSSDTKSHKVHSEKSDNKDRSEKKSKHKSSSSSEHKSGKSSSKSQEEAPKKKVSISGEDSNDGIDCGSGASFAEALGMISPVKPKKKCVMISSPSSDLSPASLLAPDVKLAPLPKIEISALPEISPNYRPRPPPKPLPHIFDEDAMNAVISSKNLRTKVYSGNKIMGKIPTLYEMCVHILQEHIDALEYTGGVPYEILKPVVDRATPQQLAILEHYNPYLMEDTDHLWKRFCEKHFRNKKRQEMEAWREMYMRCQEEQEIKLKSLTANIKIAQEAKKAPIKQTKMAYVDSVAKPPRNIAKKQALHGTARVTAGSPAARVPALAVASNVLRPGAIRPPTSAPVSHSAFNKPKKAPLMAKALQIMRGRKR